MGVYFPLKKNQNFGLFGKKTLINVKKNPIYGSDQPVLNLSVYIDNFPADFLPHHCNWLSNSRNIIFDEKNNKFLDRFTPNYDMGIMHLTGGVIEPPFFKDIRFDNISLDVITTEGKIIKKGLRFKS